jgi:hypothetical protein
MVAMAKPLVDPADNMVTAQTAGYDGPTRRRPGTPPPPVRVLRWSFEAGALIGELTIGDMARTKRS